MMHGGSRVPLETARQNPLIHTARLTLRGPRMDDAGAIFDAYAQDPEVTRYLVWTPHRSVAETETYLRGVLHRPMTGRRLSLGALRKQG